jgi:hypothetical protein
MSEFDIETVSTSAPIDAPTPARAKKATAVKAPEPEALAPVAAAPSPIKSAVTGFPLFVYVGVAEPVVISFATKDAREKACTQLTQRVNRLPTTFHTDKKAYTFFYVTHFHYEG